MPHVLTYSFPTRRAYYLDYLGKPPGNGQYIDQAMAGPGRSAQKTGSASRPAPERKGQYGHHLLQSQDGSAGTGQEPATARLCGWGDSWGYRSEEHTSELQSLMRISYAVFCLKQKKKNQKLHREQQNR